MNKIWIKILKPTGYYFLNIVLSYFVGELANAIRQKTNIKFGLHHCLFE
jgi:hypothetical protein